MIIARRLQVRGKGERRGALDGLAGVLKGGKDTIFQSGDKEQACSPLAN